MICRASGQHLGRAQVGAIQYLLVKLADNGFLFPNDLDQHPLAPATVEFPVKDLLPGAEIQPAPADRHHHLTAHHLALHLCDGVVLAGIVVPVLRDGLVWGELLQPALVVLVQAGFVVVDKDGGGNVHGVNQRFTIPTSYRQISQFCCEIIPPFQ
jgi:hypothetical protein